MPADVSSADEFATIKVRAKFFFEGDRKFFVKGVTYGPFPPNADGHFLPEPEKVRQDFALMREMGANLIRIYHVPPKWFLDLCREHGVRALISIPWAEHVEFLNNRRIRREIVRTIREAVRENAGHEAVFGYLVGNEIPSSMVRWLGARRVVEFVEYLITVARAEDPRALYSYASYPPTEYLLPQNVDFYSFNVYLHRQKDFEAYLARLQNLAGEKPLIFGEFGMDTMRHSEEEQEEMLSWHVDSVVRGGAAGTIFFAWTDEWFTGGLLIEDWAFGLVRADRTAKRAFHALKEKLGRNGSIINRVPLPRYPKVSVIVCSYNGGRTLEACLESLLKIDYPDYEVILVDDGSKDDTQEIARKFPSVRNILQNNMGLSYARNVGAANAKGEVFAYTDSDCMADPDWLYYLVGTLLSGEYAGVGGPNISPPAEDWIQACVAAAPGGPSHVLLSDVVAEHIPGCNMAFHRAAFEGIGGFDVEYRKAGDDVDFCWRLQQSGQVIAFSPAAIVWHYRRFTLKAFRKQQEGYGEAESMLRFKHLVFFGPTGTAKWKGVVYGAPRFTWLVNRPMIYHGVLGQGLFQSIYPTPQSDVAAYVSSIEWVILTVFLAVLAIPISALRMVPYLMLGATFLVALSYMIHARLEGRHDTIRARLLVAVLAFTQPLARGWARYFTWLKFKRTPRGVLRSEEEGKPRRGSSSRMVLWNESGQGREQLLAEVFRRLESEGWKYSQDTGWTDWDVQIYGNFWWSVKLRTVTEYHGGPKCLTRATLSYKPVATTVLLNVIVLSILLYRQVFTSNTDIWLWAPYLLFLFILLLRARRLKHRAADLVAASAAKCGMELVARRGRKQEKSDSSTGNDSANRSPGTEGKEG